MNRAFVVAADYGGDPLVELKQWLSISSPAQDAVLESMLRAAADLCERFTGRLPLTAFCDEMLPVSAGWIALSTRPVNHITEVAAVGPTNNRIGLDPEHFAVEISADGTGAIQLRKMPQYHRVTVRFSAGIADSWDRLDSGLRQGIIRLAGHYYRERDEGAATSPPASVAALWQPYRRLRLT